MGKPGKPTPRAGDTPRVHLYIEQEVIDWIRSTFGDSMSLSKAVRAILRSYKKRIEAEAESRRTKQPPKAEPGDLGEDVDGSGI